MKTYIYNFEYHYIVVNADDKDKAYEMAKSVIIEEYKRLNKSLDESLSGEVLSVILERRNSWEKEELRELSEIEPLVINENEGRYVAHGNE